MALAVAIALTSAQSGADDPLGRVSRMLLAIRASTGFAEARNENRLVASFCNEPIGVSRGDWI